MKKIFFLFILGLLLISLPQLAESSIMTNLVSSCSAEDSTATKGSFVDVVENK